MRFVPASERPSGLPSTVRWPLPPPGRVRHSWMLGLGLRRWQLRRMLRRAVPFLPPDGRVGLIVDLGAGTGADLEELWKAAPGTTGARALLLDAQDEMLRRCSVDRSRAVRVDRIQADGTRIPVRDGTAELVLSIGTLCCVADEAIPEVVAETARILSRGGILILAVPRRMGRSCEERTAASGLLRRAGGRPGRAIFQKPH